MKTKLSIEDKVRKDNPEFVQEVEHLGVLALEKRLADLASGAEDVEDAKNADESLELARSTAVELAAPYRDAKRAIKQKMRFIVGLLKDKAVT